MTLSFKINYLGISDKIKIQGDSGYQGITKIYTNSETPKKTTKSHPFTDD